VPETELDPKDKVQDAPTDDLTAPEVDEAPPQLDEPADDTPALGTKVHPLLPGGRRFEQVYAKGKQAEREAQELREQLAAANAKLEILGNTGKVTEVPTEYSWAQLEEFIQQGRITRADAEAHREEVIERKLANRIKGEFTTETRQATREQALDKTIQDYVASFPGITDVNSPDRARLDEEFDFQASIQGLDSTKLSASQRKAIQVTALRTVYGTIDSVRKRSVSPKTEASQGTTGGTPPAPSNNKDQQILDNLSKAQVTHYKKMMAAGRYRGGWKDVVAELKYQAPKRGGR
jgi:hypothetical protein